MKSEPIIEYPLKPGICVMGEQGERFNLDRTSGILIISFISLLVFPLLYILRFLDDNTLTNWQWVFHNASLGRIYGLMFFGLALAYLVSRISIPNRLFPVLLTVFSFSVVVPLWNEPEVIIDSARYMMQAKHLELFGINSFFREWGRGIHAWTDLPLIPFLYGSIFRYLGEFRIYIQILNTIMFSLTVMITYLLGKELWDKETGFLAGTFLLAIPYLTVQVPLMLVDVSTMFFLTLAIYLSVRSVKRGSAIMTLSASCAIVLAMYSKYSTWLMVPVMLFIPFIYWKDLPKTAGMRSLWIATIALILFSIIVFLQHDILLKQIDILRSYQWPALGKWGESFISSLLFQSHPFVILSAVAGTILAVKKRDRKFLVPFWFVLFLVAFQMARMRYIIPLLPLLALMGSYGLQWIRLRDLKRFVAYSSVSLSLVIVLVGYLPFFQRTSMANIQQAGAYLDTLPRAPVAVYTLPQNASSGNTTILVPLLDLYTSQELLSSGHGPDLKDYEAHHESPLRFTWDVKLPAFYSEAQHFMTDHVVTISGSRIKDWDRHDPFGDPQALTKFDAATGAFRYKSFVYVKRAFPLSPYGQ